MLLRTVQGASRTCAAPHRLQPACRIATGAIHAHENPLVRACFPLIQGLPRNDQRVPPSMPRRGSGVPAKRPIPNVKKVIAVSSGKGGVGKSTVAANLALGLAATATEMRGHRARVGLLDLDIFGPSIPKLMRLEDMGEPELTKRTLWPHAQRVR